MGKRVYMGVLGSIGILTISVGGCRDLSNPTLPDGTQSPTTYYSHEGGLMLAESALRQFRDIWRDYILSSGLLTDELSSTSTLATASESMTDQRLWTEYSPGSTLFEALHKLRGQTRMARGVLKEYAPTVSPAARARLYAFEAYAELWLAELYCSGVSLSTVDFDGDYTYRPSSTTSEIYRHAITLFDSALAIADDSVSVQTLARVGKARAYLGIGDYASAEDAVVEVQATDVYRMRTSFASNTKLRNYFAAIATVADGEGGNGIPFRSNGDPRTKSSLRTLPPSENGAQVAVFFPDKYEIPNDSNWVTLASGIEAQLVRAEAAMHRAQWSTWLSLLNALRTNGTYTRIDTTYTDETHTTIARIDTLWQAGAGGIAGLKPLQDPGTEHGRIVLQFSERAAWLFVSGQRQGDLRRLVRVYEWPQEEVYPSGDYTGVSQTGIYGSEIFFQLPDGEFWNPLAQGCIDRD